MYFYVYIYIYLYLCICIFVSYMHIYVYAYVFTGSAGVPQTLSPGGGVGKMVTFPPAENTQIPK